MIKRILYFLLIAVITFSVIFIVGCTKTEDPKNNNTSENPTENQNNQNDEFSETYVSVRNPEETVTFKGDTITFYYPNKSEKFVEYTYKIEDGRMVLFYNGEYDVTVDFEKSGNSVFIYGDEYIKK